MKWPGLNAPLVSKNKEVASIENLGEDVDREKRLAEIRNKMDKYVRRGTLPQDRGFTGSSLEGKSIGPPVSYDDGSHFDEPVFISREILFTN